MFKLLAARGRAHGDKTLRRLASGGPFAALDWLLNSRAQLDARRGLRDWTVVDVWGGHATWARLGPGVTTLGRRLGMIRRHRDVLVLQVSGLVVAACSTGDWDEEGAVPPQDPAVVACHVVGPGLVSASAHHGVCPPVAHPHQLARLQRTQLAGTVAAVEVRLGLASPRRHGVAMVLPVDAARLQAGAICRHGCAQAAAHQQLDESSSELDMAFFYAVTML